MLQQNCRAAKDVSLSFINEANPADFNVILIQEPYVYPNSCLSIASPKWCSYYPTQPPSDSGHPHSLLIVNTAIDHTTIKQVPSSLITTISLHPETQPLQIFNIYNLPNSDLDFADLNTCLQDTPQCQRTVWAGNFNKYHPMWLGHNVLKQCCHSNTDSLLQLLLRCNLMLHLPPGMLIYHSDSHDTWSTLDLVFSMQDIAKSLTKCLMLPDLCIPGANHLPLLTVVNAVLPVTTPTLRLNYKDVDWPKYSSTFANHIISLQLDTCVLPTTPQELDDFVKDLTLAFQLTLCQPNMSQRLGPLPWLSTGGCMSTPHCTKLMPRQARSNSLQEEV